MINTRLEEGVRRDGSPNRMDPSLAMWLVVLIGIMALHLGCTPFSDGILQVCVVGRDNAMPRMLKIRVASVDVGMDGQGEFCVQVHVAPGSVQELSAALAASSKGRIEIIDWKTGAVIAGEDAKRCSGSILTISGPQGKWLPEDATRNRSIIEAAINYCTVERVAVLEGVAAGILIALCGWLLWKAVRRVKGAK